MGQVNLSTPYTILDDHGLGEPNPSSTPVDATPLWETPAVALVNTPVAPHPMAYPLLHHPTPFAAFCDLSLLKIAPADVAPDDDCRYSVDAVAGDLYGLSLTSVPFPLYDHYYSAQDTAGCDVLMPQWGDTHDLDGFSPRHDLNQQAVDGRFLADRKFEAGHISLGFLNPQASCSLFLNLGKNQYS